MLEIRQGHSNIRPNWPPETTRNPEVEDYRPENFDCLSNLASYLGGYYFYQNEQKGQTVPLIGLGNQRPLPFITENHQVETSEKYTIFLIWEEWRQNYNKVQKDLAKGLQEGSLLKQGFLGNEKLDS